LLTGAPFLLAFFGIRSRGVLKSGRTRFLWIWAFVLFALAYVPWLPGVKFLFLIHVPICIFATMGIAALVQNSERLRLWLNRRTFVALVVVMFTAGSFGGLARDLNTSSNEPGIYVPRAQLELLEKLDALPDGNVLTSFQGGNLVPWRSGKSVFLGQWFMSYDYPDRQTKLSMFWGPKTSREDRLHLLRTQNIRYVVEDPHTGIQTTSRDLPITWIYSNRFGRIGQVELP
jgi:hypothetical protein